MTDPFVAGIGGGGFLVYYDARTHQVHTIDGRETTPLSAGQNLFIDPSTGRPLAFPASFARQRACLINPAQARPSSPRSCRSCSTGSTSG